MRSLLHIVGVVAVTLGVARPAAATTIEDITVEPLAIAGDLTDQMIDSDRALQQTEQAPARPPTATAVTAVHGGCLDVEPPDRAAFFRPTFELVDRHRGAAGPHTLSAPACRLDDLRALIRSARDRR